MKCPGCGEEISVESQRYCIYCGEPLTASNRRPERVPVRSTSTVMRMRRKADFSQTSLPEVQQSGSRKMNLASLSSGSNVAISKGRKEDNEMPKRQDQSLTNLLSKLNNPKVSSERKSASRDDSVQEEEISLISFSGLDAEDDLNVSDSDEMSFPELINEGPLSGDHPRVPARSSLSSTSRVISRPVAATQSDEIKLLNNSFDNLDLDDIDEEGEDFEPSMSLSREDKFFDEEEVSEEFEGSANSGPIPTASGTFAKTPSGGFKLMWASVKSTCSNMIEKAQNKLSKKGNSKKQAVSQSKRKSASDRQKKQKRIALVAIAVAMFALVSLIVVSAVKSSNRSEETGVATNESNDYELVALQDNGVAADDVPVFDADGFADSFDFADGEADPEAPVAAAAAARPTAIPAEAVAAAQAQANKAAGNAAPAPAKAAGKAEARKYGRNDNLFIGGSKSESFKAKRSCVMREGPASRFPFVTQINPGDKIEIITTTDEDWTFANGVWTKAGQANRLGPGTQFLPASKGSTVAAPTSRVISAKSWRYVKAGKVYGYVGPACFK